MKCALVIANGIKQVMLTPETPEEKSVLGLFASDQSISVDVRVGSFTDHMPQSSAGYLVQKCHGGYLRAFECEDSLMLVLRSKEDKVDVQSKRPPFYVCNACGSSNIGEVIREP